MAFSAICVPAEEKKLSVMHAIEATQCRKPTFCMNSEIEPHHVIKQSIYWNKEGINIIRSMNGEVLDCKSTGLVIFIYGNFCVL